MGPKVEDIVAIDETKIGVGGRGRGRGGRERGRSEEGRKEGGREGAEFGAQRLLARGFRVASGMAGEGAGGSAGGRHLISDV